MDVVLLPPVSENNELAELLRKLECPYIRVISARARRAAEHDSVDGSAVRG